VDPEVVAAVSRRMARRRMVPPPPPRAPSGSWRRNTEGRSASEERRNFKFRQEREEIPDRAALDSTHLVFWSHRRKGGTTAPPTPETLRLATSGTLL
jgi:hypothetical protein